MPQGFGGFSLLDGGGRWVDGAVFRVDAVGAAAEAVDADMGLAGTVGARGDSGGGLGAADGTEADTVGGDVGSPLVGSVGALVACGSGAGAAVPGSGDELDSPPRIVVSPYP